MIVWCIVQLSSCGLIEVTAQAFPGVAEEVLKNLSNDSRSLRWEVMRSRSATHSTVMLCVTVIILYVLIFMYEVANRRNLNWFAEVAVVAKDRYLKWYLYPWYWRAYVVVKVSHKHIFCSVLLMIWLCQLRVPFDMPFGIHLHIPRERITYWETFWLICACKYFIWSVFIWQLLDAESVLWYWLWHNCGCS